jgi:hypothetical protein
MSSAFAHHEAVRARVEGSGVIRRQRADLAELHVRRHVHRPVGAAGDREVEVAVLKALHRRLDRRHRRRARGVDGEVGPAEVERLRDAAGDHVRQLARHRVFVDLGQARLVRRFELGERGRAGARGHRREGWATAQVVRHRWPRDADRVLILDLAAERVSEDDGASVTVERLPRAGPVDGQASVGHGVGDRAQGELLHGVDLRRDARGDAEALGLEHEVRDEAADARVGAIGDGGVGVVEEGRVPPLGRNVSDRAHPAEQVAPVRTEIGRVGEPAAHADDGDRAAVVGGGGRGSGRGRDRGWWCRLWRGGRRREGGYRKCRLGGEPEGVGLREQGGTRGLERLRGRDDREPGGDRGLEWASDDRAVEPLRLLPKDRRPYDRPALRRGPGRREPRGGARGSGRRDHPRAAHRVGPLSGRADVRGEQRGERAVPLGEPGRDGDALADEPEVLAEIAGRPGVGGERPRVRAGEQAAQRARGRCVAHPQPRDDAGARRVARGEAPLQRRGERDLGATEQGLVHQHPGGAERERGGGAARADPGVEQDPARLQARGEQLEPVGVCARAARFPAFEEDAREAGRHAARRADLEPGVAARHRGAVLREQDWASARGRATRAGAHPRAVGHGGHAGAGGVDDRDGAAAPNERFEVIRRRRKQNEDDAGHVALLET